MAGPPLDEPAVARLRDDEDARHAVELGLFTRAVEHLTPAPIGEVRSQIAGSVRELALYPSLRGVPPPEGPWFDVDARVLDSRTRPHRQEADAANQQILSFVRAARERVVLLNPYVVLTKTGFDELKALCARKVEVTIFTNSPSSSDSSFTQALFLRMWPEILAGCSTARIFVWSLWQPLHGKVAVIDDDITLVGSYNVDYVSAYLNGEIGLVMRSVAFADHMRAVIEDEIARGEPLVLEYRIERDAQGEAVRHPPGHANAGQPVELYGPRDHVPAYTLLRLRALQNALDAAGAAIFIEPLM